MNIFEQRLQAYLQEQHIQAEHLSFDQPCHSVAEAARAVHASPCQGQLTFDPFRQLEMDPPRMVVREKAFFATVNVQLHSSAQQWRRKVYHLRNLVSRSLRSSSLS